MSKVVLDATAVLAFLRDEKGADFVRERLLDAVISSISLSEVYVKTLAKKGSLAMVKAVIGNFDMEVVPFEESTAEMAARVSELTQDAGMSFADRACLALAAGRNIPVVTSNPCWLESTINVEVVLFRDAKQKTQRGNSNGKVSRA